jgi:hypothetical protein
MPVVLIANAVFDARRVWVQRLALMTTANYFYEEKIENRVV